MLDSNVDHLHMVHGIRASVVHVPIEPEINAEWHATNKAVMQRMMASNLLV